MIRQLQYSIPSKMFFFARIAVLRYFFNYGTYFNTCTGNFPWYFYAVLRSRIIFMRLRVKILMRLRRLRLQPYCIAKAKFLKITKVYIHVENTLFYFILFI
jgi:hypothetical protein